MGGVIVFILVIALLIGVAVSMEKKKYRGETIASTKRTLEKDGFVISKEVTDDENNYSILIDDTKHMWAVVEAKTGVSTSYKYSDLVQYEILEDGDSVVKGRVGSVIVGGMLFGGLGALAGGARSRKVKKVCSSMNVVIVVNDLSRPQIVIPLITMQTKTASFLYSRAAVKAKEFSAVLAIIKERAEEEKGMKVDEMSESVPKSDVCDEIERLYSLKEKGILTEEEFNEKKKQLLGI